jgi:hypothetical protein
MITESQHTIMRQFFAGFFHQDWRVEADAPDQVISNYAAQLTDRSTLVELSEAIAAFIADHPAEDDLANALFRQLGCYYAPKAIGESTKQWLVHVAERFKAENEAKST